MRFIFQDATWENSWVFLYLQSFIWLIPMPCFWTKVCLTPINIGLVFSPPSPSPLKGLLEFCFWINTIKTKRTEQNNSSSSFVYRENRSSIKSLIASSAFKSTRSKQNEQSKIRAQAAFFMEKIIQFVKHVKKYNNVLT